MPGEYVFAPKNKPLGNLPLPVTLNTLLGPEWESFKRGYNPPTLGRNQIVALPNGHRVWRSELWESDRDTYSNLCMNQANRGGDYDGGFAVGETCAAVFGFKLADDFPTPPSWGLVWEIHTPSDYPPGYASPMTALTLDGGVLKIKDNSEGDTTWTGLYERGRFHYMAVEVKLGRPGYTKVWHLLDKVPNVAAAPNAQSANNTVPPTGVKPSTPKVSLYRSPGSTTTGTPMKHVVFWDGYVQTGSIARSMELFQGICNPDALPGPPSDSLPLTVLETGSNYTLIGWDPVEEGLGYKFTVDGKVSHTWNTLLQRDPDFPACNQRFAKTYTKIEVEALGVLAKGDLP